MVSRAEHGASGSSRTICHAIETGCLGDTVVVVVVQAAIDFADRDGGDVNRIIGGIVVRGVMSSIPDRLIERGDPRHSQCVDGALWTCGGFVPVRCSC